MEVSFKYLLVTSIKVPIDPEVRKLMDEISGQVEEAAMFAMEICFVLGKTAEEACTSTKLMVEEYMQDPARSKYRKLILDHLCEFIESEWEFIVDPSL